MAMRLLPKSEILKAKAQERKTEIDEGVKLAKHVDALRGVAAQEEVALETFRRESVARITQEIQKKVQERDALESRNAFLRDERVELERPLTREWENIDLEKAGLLVKHEELSLKDVHLAEKQRDIELEEKKVRAALSRAQTKEELLSKSLEESVGLKKEAEQELLRAQQIKDRAVKLKETTDRELTHRDRIASSRERDATLKEQSLAVREQEISIERIQLADMRATLERAFNRITK